MLLLCFLTNLKIQAQEVLPIWQEGYLDIHHINTGSGDATYFIFPDGTSMLFDLGASNEAEDNPEYFKLKTNSEYTAAEIVANYIQKIHPNGRNAQLDYAVISHFHEDHYGDVDEHSKLSDNGKYYLTGITEIDKYVPIKVLIDRAYPGYDFPSGFRQYNSNNKTFKNYLNFIDSRKEANKSTERIQAGSQKQITLKHKEYPEFEVRNLKENLTIWAGQEDSVINLANDFKPLIVGCGFNENPLSIALLIRYGDFKYFTGGDITGYNWRNVLDVETPIANAIGEVDAMALNHHGFHDATNEYFMKTLNPRVVVNQSRHTPHFQFTPLQNLVKVKADFYANNMHDETFYLFSDTLKNLVKGINGHVVIRVKPGGKEYFVYMLEDDDFSFKVLKTCGPYLSK